MQDLMTGPSANSPRYSASSEPSTPASPSFISHSPAVSPPPTEELLNTSYGQLHQHYRDAKQQTRKIDPSMPRDTNDNLAIPRKLDGKERSRSPKKTYPGEHEPRSSSPRKTKKDNIRQEMPQKAIDGLRSSSGRRHQDEDPAQKQDRAMEVSRGDSERYQRNKTAEPQKPHNESGTINRKDHRGLDSPRWDEDSKAAPSETPQNGGNPSAKKAPITPGPWKVPSSTRVQPPVHGV